MAQRACRACAAELEERIQDNVEECLSRPPQAGAPNRKSGADIAGEVHAGPKPLQLRCQLCICDGNRHCCTVI